MLMQIASRILAILLCCASVLGDTEIINFVSDVHDDFSLNGISHHWPSINASSTLFTIKPESAYLPHSVRDTCRDAKAGECPHELWVALDLGDIQNRERIGFTLRASWPAHMPADFSLQLFSPSEVASAWNVTSSATANAPSRRQFARIRAKSKGILTPIQRPRTGDAESLASPEPEPVQFHLIVERLHFGLVPESLIPTIYTLIAVILSASAFVPYVYTFLAKTAEGARVELAQREKKL
ncbi:hypothetical protein BOTBODRAFT_31554 [Botryobasidium botryosum FD-172 SS1]|uniref:Uncharacterized protein n=1 Tax=Botryobasidium botryosum (strain FD-172 SS1) TaxID=930990 RepID=A0A067MLR3_BOTB1|nr:hypothetical protein BOTBODRAFT_31554 [Botryobasidium botryosum FD-172 SS1]